MQKKHSSRLWWSVEYAAIVLMCTVLLGLMGCKESDPLSTGKEIVSFDISLSETEAPVPGIMDTARRIINVPLNKDVSVAWLVPVITVSEHASVSPRSGEAVDFTTPQTYTVTAEDGSIQDYLVSVSTPPRPDTKSISFFALKAKDGTDVGNAGTSITETIAIEVPWNTDVKWLVPTINHDGASVSPAAGEAQDFSTPVPYTVTAQNGSTKQYLVSVTLKDAGNVISAFSVKAKDGTTVGTAVGTPDVSADTIVITVPWGTDVKWLVPVITHGGASIEPAAGVAQDFSTPVPYTVTAENGTTKNYLVSVKVTNADAKAITSFSLKAKDGSAVGTPPTTIGNPITFTAQWDTDVTNLVPDIHHSGVSITPPSGQAQDFSRPVQYTVTAVDGSTAEYVVAVKQDGLSDITVTPPTKVVYNVGDALDLAGL
jgi:hypothetical protein